MASNLFLILFSSQFSGRYSDFFKSNKLLVYAAYLPKKYQSEISEFINKI